jgi:hypothetical protein
VNTFSSLAILGNKKSTKLGKQLFFAIIKSSQNSLRKHIFNPKLKEDLWKRMTKKAKMPRKTPAHEVILRRLQNLTEDFNKITQVSYTPRLGFLLSNRGIFLSFYNGVEILLDILSEMHIPEKEIPNLVSQIKKTLMINRFFMLKTVLMLW